MVCACRKSGVSQACSEDVSPSSPTCPDFSGTRLPQGSSSSSGGPIPKGWLCEGFPGLTQPGHQVLPCHTRSKVFPPAPPSVGKKAVSVQGFVPQKGFLQGRLVGCFFKKSFSIALSSLLNNLTNSASYVVEARLLTHSGREISLGPGNGCTRNNIALCLLRCCMLRTSCPSNLVCFKWLLEYINAI